MQRPNKQCRPEVKGTYDPWTITYISVYKLDIAAMTHAFIYVTETELAYKKFEAHAWVCCQHFHGIGKCDSLASDVVFVQSLSITFGTDFLVS